MDINAHDNTNKQLSLVVSAAVFDNNNQQRKTDQLLVGWMDGWVDGWMDGYKRP